MAQQQLAHEQKMENVFPNMVALAQLKFPTDDQIIEFFKSKPIQKVQVGEKFYPCKTGTQTESGCYKNGWTAEVIKDKWLKILIYTSARSEIDIEERFLFKIVGDGYKIKKHTGWNSPHCPEGIDLLKMSKRQYGNGTTEYMDMLKSLYKSHTK
tara:strand:+ start:86 stop:547 length:462 start_codon:yes stop_codon:yes gene_type:complete